MLGEQNQDLFPCMSEVFSGMWSLEDYDDNQEVKDIIAKAIANPNSYVVKPQKEGGGNNYYDEDAKELLIKFISQDTLVQDKEALK